jgi:hypothetical protein
MTLKILTFILVFVPIAGLAEPSVVLMAGGPSGAKFITDRIEIVKKATGVTVEVKVAPADTCLSALFKGLADLALIGMNPDEAISMAEKKGLIKPGSGGVDAEVLHTMKPVFGLNPENKVTTLTREQVVGILTGKITDWELINGWKMPIHVLMAKNFMSANKAVTEQLLDTGVNPVATLVIDREGLRKGVQRDKGAIGIFTTTESSADFSPRFIPSGISSKSYLILRKTARPETRMVYEALLAHKE